jgi:hypothetical protein
MRKRSYLKPGYFIFKTSAYFPFAEEGNIKFPDFPHQLTNIQLNKSHVHEVLLLSQK